MPDDATLPEATLFNFISGFVSQILMQLGEVPNPMSGQREANLAYARYSIRILQILREKMQGNLTDEERDYIDGALTNFAPHLNED